MMNKIKQYLLSVMKDERKTPDAYVAAAFLRAASIVYLFALWCRNLFYKTGIARAQEAPLKVISVGNITLGGTGKTPFAILLAEEMKKEGRKPAVLSRGYGGDEAVLIEERLSGIPVLTGRDRVRNARKAKNELGRDCVILDDGFQHRRIKRDLDIVMLDATSALGRLKNFPRGTLREPLSRLAAADIAILTKTDMGHDNVPHIRQKLKAINKDIDIAESTYQAVGLKEVFSQEERALKEAAGKKVALLAGIASPDYFAWMVERLGCEVIERFYYSDHHPFAEIDIASAVKKCRDAGIRTIITTEKDAVRLRKLDKPTDEISIFALKMDFRIDAHEEVIRARLHSVFSS